jgi:hypothetical protein
MLSILFGDVSLVEFENRKNVPFALFNRKQ